MTRIRKIKTPRWTGGVLQESSNFQELLKLLISRSEHIRGGCPTSQHHFGETKSVKPYQRKGKKKRISTILEVWEFVNMLWIPYLPLPTLWYLR